MNDINEYDSSQPQYTWTEETPIPPRLTREEVWFQAWLKLDAFHLADNVLKEFDERFNEQEKEEEEEEEEEKK